MIDSINPGILFAFSVALPALCASLWEIGRQRKRAQVAHDEARTDPLTGIKNVREWKERTNSLQASGESFSFVLFDLANLKAANSALGHTGADAILRRVAGEIRDGDQVGNRIGGDEFSVCLPNTSIVGACALRRRIEERIGLIEVAPGVLVFLVGAVGEWTPDCDLVDAFLKADFELERRKAAKKESLGLPLSREETLALLPQA